MKMTPKPYVLLGLIVGTAWAMTQMVGQGAQADPRAAVTFTKDIAPILQRSCQNCHRPDSIAPMSLADV